MRITKSRGAKSCSCNGDPGDTALIFAEQGRFCKIVLKAIKNLNFSMFIIN